MFNNAIQLCYSLDGQIIYNAEEAELRAMLVLAIDIEL